MTICDAIKFIVHSQDDSLLKSSRKFMAHIRDLSSEYPKEIKILNRALDDKILERIFGNERDNVKISRIRDEFETQGLSESWSEFIINSFGEVLGWEKIEIVSFANETPTNNIIPQTTSKKTKKAIKNTYGYKNVSLNKTVLHHLYNLAIIDSEDKDELTEIDIPETYTYRDKNYRITSIGANCFEDYTSLRYVTIPDTVTKIKEYAFSNCDSLESIDIPDSVIKIEEYAFSNAGLESIEIPDSVTKIGTNAFENCTSLTELTIGSEYVDYDDPKTIIEEYAFSDCNSLTEVRLYGNIVSIGDYAFSDCESLEEIEIPDSVTEIGEYAFSGTSLGSIEIPDGVTNIGDNAFLGIATVYYDGTATGEPWGADEIEFMEYDEDDDYDDEDDEDWD